MLLFANTFSVCIPKQVEAGVWELDATIEVRAGSVVKIMGEVRRRRKD